jgi:UDP-N-acetyl-D-glucosamine dehydrogenase
VTYKKDVNDIRDSKAVEIFTQLMQRGIDVRYHDPFVSKIEIKNKTIVSTPLTPKVLDEMDCIVILTDHSNMPLEMILEHSSLVFDTRNAVRGKNGKAKVIKLGGGK